MDRTDTRDLINLAQMYVQMDRCPGERLVPAGLVCPWCGVDYTEDGAKCKRPKRRHTPKPANVPATHLPETP